MATALDNVHHFSVCATVILACPNTGGGRGDGVVLLFQKIKTLYKAVNTL